MNWPEKYVGLPFVDFGRGFQGTDCWGLVRLVLKTECGIDVPSYGEISANDLVRVTETIGHDADDDPWLRIERGAIKPFDVALMRGRPLHVGIMASQTHLLHVEVRTAAVLLPLNHLSIARRVIGFRRHKLLEVMA